SLAPNKLQIGVNLTKGLGAGSDPQKGKQAAEESIEDIKKTLQGADMVFITAGMGGGTGTGASPIIAKVAKELGALTIGVVTKPFSYEGKNKEKIAKEGLESLKQIVDSIIIVPNQKLFDFYKNLTLIDAFKKVDDILRQAVQSIVELVQKPSDNASFIINIDFADAQTIMSEKGIALMGIGEATGDNRIKIATEMAISNPLLENTSIEGAKGILMNITASSNFGLQELEEAASIIQNAMNEQAIFKYGFIVNDALEDKVRVTIIATGFEEKNKNDSIKKINKYKNIDKNYFNEIRKISEMPIEDKFDIPTYIRNKDE
ncbi:cell division protein FtsZ, partial [Desulfurella sp.]|uniref:cell division protein FtsZ n=1 Tax=Desulfurella sp. TaxID=1962857 RepID=UPI0025BCEC10